MSHTSLALLHAQKPQYVATIREFLESRGCGVTEIYNTDDVLDYEIISGDSEYVQRISAHEITSGVKRFVIIFAAIGAEIPQTILASQPLIVLLNDEPVPSRLVSQVFAYFFTNSQGTLDLRTEKPTVVKQYSAAPHHPHVSEQIINTHTPRETRSNEDRARISSIIQRVYDDQGAKQKKPGNKLLKHITIGLFIVLVSIPVVTTGLLATGLGMTMTSVYALSKTNTSTSKHVGHAAKKVLTAGLYGVQLSTTPVRLVAGEQSTRELERVVVFVRAIADLSVSASDVVERVYLFVEANTPGAQPSGVVSVDSLQNELFFLGSAVDVMFAELQQILSADTWVSRAFLVFTKDRIAQIQQTRRYVDRLQQALQIYPYIGGFKEPQTILVLLQNNMELRPTGGFIGSVAILTLEGGTTKNIEVLDVYTLDGQLKGHVPPPDPIRSVLGQIHWYLRDSNWNPDFRAAAQQAAWFYEKETGDTPDVVAGLTLPVIQDLLRATGPMDLPDYDDRITADNVFVKSLYYIHEGFFPGSTQKKDFLQSLTSAILTNIASGDQESKKALVQAFVRGVEERNIMIYSDLPPVQELVERFGWSGRVPSFFPCGEAQQQKACVGDYFYLSEANLGVNKANYFIERSIVHDVEIISSKVIKHTVSVVYTNTSQGDSDGGGSYVNYARAYLPLNTVIDSVQYDGQNLQTKRSDTTPSPYAEIEYDAPEGLLGLGLSFVVPPSSTNQLVLSYTTSTPIDVEAFDYKLLIQKQPGIINTTQNTSVSHSPRWVSQKLPEQPGQVMGVSSDLDKSGRLEYNTPLQTDEYIQVRLEDAL